MDKVLFICGRNSGRSQMAAAILEKLGQDRFQVYSAGLDPAPSVNPLVIEVIKRRASTCQPIRPVPFLIL